ncbi:PREDICTED: uncharacterized protein LOC104980823 [Bison bison bison]|uniref:Uncharacterized protein LOC104980823 n=1 Tax=Bison bison bison TaxID=43346 RepID=A0A6P3GMG8_BISBB|nr:PREDICTED: uncharacterized protein LOC104980823 [Bison bison bison]
MPGRQLFLEQGSEPGDWDGRPAPGLPVGSTQPGQAHLLRQKTQIGGRRPRRHAVGCPAGHSSFELYHVWVCWGCTGCSSSCYHGHYPVENTANSDRTSGPRVHTGNTGQAPLCQVTSPASAARLCYSAVMQLRQGLALWLTGREAGMAHRRVLSCPHFTWAPGPGGGGLANRERFPCDKQSSLTKGAGRITQPLKRTSSPPWDHRHRPGFPLASPKSSPSQHRHPHPPATVHARSKAPSSLRLSVPPASTPAQIWTLLTVTTPPAGSHEFWHKDGELHSTCFLSPEDSASRPSMPTSCHWLRSLAQTPGRTAPSRQSPSKAEQSGI